MRESNGHCRHHALRADTEAHTRSASVACSDKLISMVWSGRLHTVITCEACNPRRSRCWWCTCAWAWYRSSWAPSPSARSSPLPRGWSRAAPCGCCPTPSQTCAGLGFVCADPHFYRLEAGRLLSIHCRQPNCTISLRNCVMCQDLSSHTLHAARLAMTTLVWQLHVA